MPPPASLIPGERAVKADPLQKKGKADDKKREVKADAKSDVGVKGGRKGYHKQYDNSRYQNMDDDTKR